MDLTVIVPTFNEGPNVAELVRRVGAALHGLDIAILRGVCGHGDPAAYHPCASHIACTLSVSSLIVWLIFSTKLR